MDVKQEPVDSYEETVIIKQENVFINPENIIKLEEHDWASQTSSMGAVPNLTQEPQVEALLESSLNDISEVTASEYFVNTNDIVSIKRENPEFDVNVSELLTAQCDLPTLKSETIDYYNQPCSSKQAQELSRQKKNVRKKVRKIKRKRKYPCPICRKSPMKPKHFNLHFKAYVICALCGHFFVRKKEFLTHYFNHYFTKKSKNKFQVNTVNIKSEIIPITDKRGPGRPRKDRDRGCKFCNRLFADVEAHQRRGTCLRIFKCDVCLRTFKTKQHLGYHLLIHTTDKLFQCEICLNTFRTKYILSSHMRIHTDPKLFQCDTCFIVLTTKHELHSHVKLHHSNQDLYYECELCPKTFRSRNGRKKHTKLHHEPKINSQPQKPIPFIPKHPKVSIGSIPLGENTCENCSIKFKTKEIYEKHLELNRLDEPFNCEICLGFFNQKCHSFTHVRTNIYLECEFCKETFQGKGILTRHINVKHSDNSIEPT